MLEFKHYFNVVARYVILQGGLTAALSTLPLRNENLIFGVTMLTLIYLSYILLFFIMSSLYFYIKNCVYSDGFDDNDSFDFDWCNELLLELQNSIKSKIKKNKKQYRILKNILFNKRVYFVAKLKKYSGYYFINSFFME